MIPYNWKQFIYHAGRARDPYSIAKTRLVAGGKERKEGRQTIFFTPLDLFNSDASEADLITDFKKPREVHYQIHWRLDQDAVYWIHLSTAQDAGLKFWQTGSNAIITYQSVPKECVVKVVNKSEKATTVRNLRLEKDQTCHSEILGFLRGPPFCTENESQMWDSNSVQSESRSWPNEECEQTVDLRVNDIPSDKGYKDKQYMQRIAEQFQKLVNTESFF